MIAKTHSAGARAFALLPGLAAFGLAIALPALNALLSGLIAGVLIGNVFRLPASFRSASGATGTRLLEYSVIFLAFGVQYEHLMGLGWKSLLMVTVIVLAVILASYRLSKRPVNWLIGFGTAICGSSAIAAVAPSVAKDKSDAGIAIAVVNLYGTLGMLALPLAFKYVDATPAVQAMFIGGSLHAVGNVAGAGYMMSNEVGELAVMIKLARVSMLSFGVILLNLLSNSHGSKSWWSYLKLPWYITGFILISVVVSFTDIPAGWLKNIDFAGKLILTIAMTNIGIQIRFRDLWQSGKSGLLFGLSVFAFQLMIIGLFVLWM